MNVVAELRCPSETCRDKDKGTRVIDTRGETLKRRIRRRRQCIACGMRWTTYEYPEHVVVTKADLKGVILRIERELLKVKLGLLS